MSPIGENNRWVPSFEGRSPELLVPPRCPVPPDPAGGHPLKRPKRDRGPRTAAFNQRRSPQSLRPGRRGPAPATTAKIPSFFPPRVRRCASGPANRRGPRRPMNMTRCLPRFLGRPAAPHRLPLPAVPGPSPPRLRPGLGPRTGPGKPDSPGGNVLTAPQCPSLFGRVWTVPPAPSFGRKNRRNDSPHAPRKAPVGRPSPPSVPCSCVSPPRRCRPPCALSLPPTSGNQRCGPGSGRVQCPDCPGFVRLSSTPGKSRNKGRTPFIHPFPHKIPPLFRLSPCSPSRVYAGFRVIRWNLANGVCSRRFGKQALVRRTLSCPQIRPPRNECTGRLPPAKTTSSPVFLAGVFFFGKRIRLFLKFQPPSDGPGDQGVGGFGRRFSQVQEIHPLARPFPNFLEKTDSTRH